MISAKPSPLTSPAPLTAHPVRSYAVLPLILNPLDPLREEGSKLAAAGAIRCSSASTTLRMNEPLCGFIGVQFGSLGESSQSKQCRCARFRLGHMQGGTRKDGDTGARRNG